jgi:serine/threonine protein kinase
MELGQIINSGTYGCIHKSKDEKYVIKVDQDDDQEYVSNEIKILNSLQGHPNIVKMFPLHSFFQEEGKEKEYEESMNFWIVMEPAQSNLELFRPTIGGETRNVIRQLFSGLAYIHSNKIIHGDLKPSNILVFNEGKRVAICDFGNSITFDRVRLSTDELTTLWYRAPESIAWQTDWDEKIDVWSMGCIYHYLLGKGLVCDKTNEIKCLKQISKLFGYLKFEHPPLFRGVRYWNKEGKIYKGESSSELLHLEKEDKILDACLVPLAKFRKSAQEIVQIFNE